MRKFMPLLFVLCAFAIPAAAQDGQPIFQPTPTMGEIVPSDPAPAPATPIVEIAFIGVLIILGVAVGFLGISNPLDLLAIAKRRAEKTINPWDNFAVQLGEIIAKAVTEAMNAAKEAAAKPPTPLQQLPPPHIPQQDSRLI